MAISGQPVVVGATAHKLVVRSATTQGAHLHGSNGAT